MVEEEGRLHHSFPPPLFLLSPEGKIREIRDVEQEEDTSEQSQLTGVANTSCMCVIPNKVSKS